MPFILRALTLFAMLLSCGVAGAKELAIPGLEMDEVSKQLVEGWRKRVAQRAMGFAQCPVAIRQPRGTGRRTLVEGTYRFELIRGAITWTDPERGRQVEQGWWRTQLDNLLVEPGVLLFLAHSKLTAQSLATGTEIRVAGRSPVTALRFDAAGTLASLSVRVPGPGGTLHPADIRLTYKQLGGHLLLTGYTMTTTESGAQASEKGTIVWKRVRDRPLPSRITLELRMGERRLPIWVDLGPWKLKGEALAKMDLVSSRALQAWEKRELNLARRDFEKGECDVEFQRGAGIARGRYRFDGKRGKVTWQDPEVGKRLGPDWHTSLDDLFLRYPLRVALGTKDLAGKKEGVNTIVTVKEGLSLEGGVGYRRFTFSPLHVLTEIQLARGDGTKGVLTPTYRKFPYPKGHLLAGVTRYRAPTRWSGRWTRFGGSTYTTTKTISYVPHRGAHVPSRIEIRRTEAGKPPVALTFRLRNWRLTEVPSSLTR